MGNIIAWTKREPDPDLVSGDAAPENVPGGTVVFKSFNDATSRPSYNRLAQEKQTAANISQRMFAEACVLEEKGCINEAEEIYRTIDASTCPLAKAAINLGTILYNRRDFNAAAKYYRRAVELDPEDALAHFDLANALDELQQIPESITHYKRAIELVPTYADPHYNLALAYERQKEDIKALRHWQEYIRLDPNGPWTSHAKGQAERILGRSPLVQANAKPSPVTDAAPEESLPQPLINERAVEVQKAEPLDQSPVAVQDSYKLARALNSG